MHIGHQISIAVAPAPASFFQMQGAAISWRSHRQATTALSTTEAEYMALSEAVQEAIWLKNLDDEVRDVAIENPFPLICDNKGAIALSQNDASHQGRQWTKA